MHPKICPTEPLSQVVFIHDYFQLVFQNAGFSIYNPSELIQSGTSLSRGQPGFCDGLVNLIGQPLISASASPTLSLTFQGGALVVVARSGAGPEAWQYNSLGGPIVVEQNA
ncbi:MAG: hypothetical protein BVN34_04500 [Proteobacteria bacterium ST_bin12]|nr:MAG: hypothetical protein BVN34_04500 [Proteobacteria bacterium ST_bin12]